MDSVNNGTGGDWSLYRDEDLVRLAQQGHFQAVWEEIWRRTQEWLIPFACQLAWGFGLHNTDMPDVQQQAALAVEETLRRLCRPRKAGRKTSRLPTLLHLVLNCRIRDFARNTRTAERRYDHTQDAATALEGSGDPRRPASQTTPLKQLLRQEDIERVRQALAQLPAEARQVVESRLEGKTFAQIAQELGKSESTVLRLWNETLERLRSQLPDLADWDAE
jgi:RNA polymerase sigma factor (sigma-70 family)